MRFLIVVAIVASCLYCTDGLDCMECKPEKCKVFKCVYGLVKDACMCCDVCGKGPGEVCGGDFFLSGRCGTGLVCVTRKGAEQQPGRCRRPH